MYIATKMVVRGNRSSKVRIKSLNWQGTRYGLEVDGEITNTGSEQFITDLYNKF